MIRIQGKEAGAVCFADQIAESAARDIRALCDSPLMKERRIRLMPDVHSNGDGTLTGFTMLSKEPVILKLEYGSGCGVSCARLHIGEEDRAGLEEQFAQRDDLSGRAASLMQRLDTFCHEIPAGRDSYFEPAFGYDFSGLSCYDAVKEAYEWPVALGSLGGGNHFIELDRDEEGRYYLVVHNGLGGLTRPVVRHFLGRTLAASGKSYRQARLEDTCLWGKEREDYLQDMQIFEDVCRVNRRYITEYIAGRMGWEIDDLLDICHHYTDPADGIVRHGAIDAHAGRQVIIPISAGAGCILGTGKGNPEWNCSAPHGAGRLYRRRDAREAISMEEYRQSMRGVYSTTIEEGNLDEAPAAYRSMETIAQAIADTVRIDRIIRPVYSYKGV